MRKKILLLLFCSAFALATTAQTIFENCQDGKVYVKLKKKSAGIFLREDPTNISPAKSGLPKNLLLDYGVTKISRPFYHATDDEHLPAILKLEFTDIANVEEFIRKLKAVDAVEYAEKIPISQVSITTPNDFAISSASVHLSQINAEAAWDYFNGNSNITVAIIDNAVMWSHADLISNTYTNTLEANGISGVDDDGNGYVDDINGFNVSDNNNNAEPVNGAIHFHGTICAGIAGARTDNGIGVASIGWNLKIIPVQCEPDASSSSLNVANGYEGIIYATRSKARIISCSWGSQGFFSQSEQYVIDYAWNRGSIVIASAGNLASSTLFYPAAYNHVYAVAAVGANDVAWSGSNYGTWVDVSAPGVNIMTTMTYSGTPSYQSFTGTSFSAPMVAGLAGLMLSKSPGMTRTDVLNCISSTAANIYSLSGNASYSSGNQLGAGRIDAFAAMACASTYSALPPVANFYAFLPNTCPNTPIPFIDSSLYFPTSWSWTFQGGTPATSTSSNPSVQWTTPGTYSVSLTVSNANGSHTKTKLAYITVAGPSALPFSEGFESNPFLPAGWVANNIGNDNLYWERITGVGGFGTSTACARFDNFSMNPQGEKDEMRSPKFDFSQVATARLRFDVAYARYNATYSDTLEVKISTDCGTSWTSIYYKGGTQLSTKSDQGAQFVPTATQWRRDSIDVSGIAAGQGNVMFSFLNKGNFGQPIYLDNINLVFPTPTLVTVNNTSICTSPTYTFSNNSLSATNYSWTFQGGVPATSSASNPAITYANPGTYTLSLSGSNGTSSTSITRTITVLNNPTVTSLSGTYCAGANYSLTASGASTYTWSSISGVVGTGAILPITPQNNITYTVTGSNGACSAEGFYTVNTVPSPSLSVINQTVCAGSTATLSASGAISYSWSTGATGPSIQLSPGSTTTYTVYGSDSQCSSSATMTVQVTPTPAALISASNTSCFNSCDGKVNALVSGGSAPYTYSISTCSTLPCENLCPGVYTLIASNAEGCQSSATVSVLAPAALQSNISATHAACATCADGVLLVNTVGGTAPYTFTWSPAGGNNAEATGLLPGCYTVSVEDVKGCIAETSSCVSISTGLSDVSLNSHLLIYPNPAKTEVTLQLNAGSFSYRLYSSLGQVVLEKQMNKNEVSIDLTHLAKGVYLIEVESGAEVLRKKIILE